MNIKQFFILKACDVLPSDLKYYILNLLEYYAAEAIQNLYRLKVAKNVDIFMKYMQICDNCNNYSRHYVNNFLNYSVNNITYNYIQEPRAWIIYTNRINDIYGDHILFNSDSLRCIISVINTYFIIYNERW